MQSYTETTILTNDTQVDIYHNTEQSYAEWFVKDTYPHLFLEIINLFKF